ncbi:MAG: flagellar export protein FliJ [Rhodanobacteraceae bacterium]
MQHHEKSSSFPDFTMTPSNVLDTLIEESRKSRDHAGRALAEDRRTQQLTTQQLDALRHYKHEYHAGLGNALVRGIDIGTLHNYQRFIHSLDDAIGNAGLQLQQNTDRVHASQQRWTQQQRQLSSYDTLATRRAARLDLAESRREQRSNDELSNNMHARRQPGTR